MLSSMLVAAAALYIAGILYGWRRRSLAGLGYPSPEEARERIERLAATRSDLCALEELGRSTEGRPIQALRIRGRQAHAGERPRLLVTANIHAVEYIGSYVARALAARLVEGYGKVEHITDLLDRAEVWFVPLLNPDGAERVWRQRGWSGLGGSRFTANGVDPNRNFPFVPVGGRQGWNTARDKPGSPYYRGPHPLSEPECLALANLCERERFCAAINFHSFGGLVFMPALPSAAAKDSDAAKAGSALDVFRGVFQSHQRVRYRPVPERSAAIVGQLDPFLLNTFGTVSVTIEVSRPGPHVLLPWNILNVFWWANPSRPQRWAENDVEASVHALAALLERTGGTPCIAAHPEPARVGGASDLVDGNAVDARSSRFASTPGYVTEPLRGTAKRRTPPILRELAYAERVARHSPELRSYSGLPGHAPRVTRQRAMALILAGTLASACNDNPNYTLEACHMISISNETAPVARQASDLRVMTLNMWGIDYVSADIDARFDALAERLNADDAIDVVGFQEVWADVPRQRLLKKLAKRFPHQADFQTEHGRSGLAIVSRHEFAAAPRFVPFPRTGKWWKPWTGEWFGGKGIGAVELKTGAGHVWFVVTHLHACYEPRERGCDGDDEYAVYRGHQLETLRATVNDLAGDEPALIAGDFNFTKASKYFLALTTNGVYPAGVFDPAWQRIDEPAAPARRIDYIWVRPGRDGTWSPVEEARVVFAEPVRGAKGTEVPLSDHCAVAATLRRGG